MHTRQKISLVAIIVFLSIIVVGCASALHSKPGTTTTVILIRHADRDDLGELTAQGHARARALVDAVGNMDIAAIYSPDLSRNIDTVKPLALHLGIDITYTPKVSMPMVGKIANEILTKYAGRTVLWVGNVSGNLQAIYHRLGGKDRGPLDYGQLFILTIPDQGPTRVAKSSFGTSS